MTGRRCRLRRCCSSSCLTIYDGTPVFLWSEDADAPPINLVLVGAWETDDGLVHN